MNETANIIMQKITDRGFLKKDLRIICTQMGYDYENIPGETKVSFTMGLVLEAKRWGSKHLEMLNQLIDTYEFPTTRISDTLRVSREELLEKVDTLLLMAVEQTSDIHDYNQRKISVQLAQAYATVASALMQRLEIARGEHD